jgi:hypothetical protein
VLDHRRFFMNGVYLKFFVEVARAGGSPDGRSRKYSKVRSSCFSLSHESEQVTERICASSRSDIRLCIFLYFHEENVSKRRNKKKRYGHDDDDEIRFAASPFDVAIRYCLHSSIVSIIPLSFLCQRHHVYGSYYSISRTKVLPFLGVS